MNKKELETFAKQAAKGIKSEQDLTDFRKIPQEFVALNSNSQLLLNRASYLDLFFLRTTRSRT